MCTNAIYKLYYCILFFSLSQHKANTTELHPKVRQTCYSSNLFVLRLTSENKGQKGNSKSFRSQKKKCFDSSFSASNEHLFGNVNFI